MIYIIIKHINHTYCIIYTYHTIVTCHSYFVLRSALEIARSHQAVPRVLGAEGTEEVGPMGRCSGVFLLHSLGESTAPFWNSWCRPW